MFKALKQIIYTYTMGYKDYQEEIKKYSADIQKKYSKHLFWFFFIYTILMLVTDVYFWNIFYPQILYGLLLAVISLINWVVFHAGVPQKKNRVMKAGNIFLFLFLQLLKISYTFAGGYISHAVLTCVIISTAMLAMNPLHYFWIMLSALFTGMILDYISLDIMVAEMGYFFVDSFATLVIAMEISFLLCKMRYQQFKEKIILRKENSTDVLTGLYNRKYFEWFYYQSGQKDGMCAMIHLDLDNFKLCNDTFGHQAGDSVLCQTAAILKENFRQTDCVARVGGDEFMVFMSGLPGAHIVMQKTEEILKKFPICYGEGEKQVKVSVSMGLAFSHPGEELSYEEMYLNADAAMYRAKRAGKGQAVVFGKREKHEE